MSVDFICVFTLKSTDFQDFPFNFLCVAREVDGQILPPAQAQVSQRPAQSDLTRLLAMTRPRLEKGCQGYRHH